MRIGGSLFLIALGAILTWAVKVNNTHGFNVHDAGIILMIVGAVGLAITLIWMSTRRRTDVITSGPMGARRSTVVEPNDPAYGPY